MKKLLTLIALMLMLVGCSEMPEEKVEAEPKKEVVVQEPKEEPKVEEPVEIEEPAIPNMTEEKQEILDYINSATPHLEKITMNIEDIGEVAQIGADNPAIIPTAKYQETVQLICDDLQRNIDAMRDIPIGDNETLKGLMINMNNGLDDLEFVAQNFPTAVRTMDNDLIIKSSEALGDSSFFMTKVAEEITEIAGDFQ